MKKQLFLSVAILAFSGDMFARIGGAGAGGTSTPPRRAPSPAPAPRQGGGSVPTPPAPTPPAGSAAQVAEGLTPAQAISSAMKALNVTAAEVAAAQPVSAAVSFIQG